MGSPMKCHTCNLAIHGEDWTMVTQKEGDEYVTGFFCSTEHLVDFIAVVGAMDADPDHERWDTDEQQ